MPKWHTKQKKTQVHDLDRQRATPSSADCPIWQTMTESGDNLTLLQILL